MIRYPSRGKVSGVGPSFRWDDDYIFCRFERSPTLKTNNKVRSALLTLIAMLVAISLTSIPLQTVAQSKPDAVAGTWGAVQADGAPKCEGTTVMVFHQGTYFRVLPNVGSTGGINQLILNRSTYRLRGDRLVVAQGLSFTNPEPRRTFLVPRIGGRSLILQGKGRVTFKPCPPIDPKGLDAVVK